jgi:hypothetical protein
MKRSWTHVMTAALLSAAATAGLTATPATAAPAGTCSVSTSNSAWIASYDVFSPTDKVIANGTLTINCHNLTPDSTVSVSVGVSGASGSTYQTPSITLSGTPLAFTLFVPGAPSTQWDLTHTYQTTLSVNHGGNVPSTAIPAFNIDVPALQDVPVGAYTGNVYFTVTCLSGSTC